MANTYRFENTTWFRGTGAQAKMQSNALLNGHTCQISCHEPLAGDRIYTSFPSWREAIEVLYKTKNRIRYYYELMPVGKPTKMYFDFDKSYDGDNEERIDRDAFVSMFEDLLTKACKALYSTELKKQDFIWTETTNPTKFSLHLVVAPTLPDGTMLVFEDNVLNKHIVHYLLEMNTKEDYPILHQVLDTSVYSRNRNMRMLGCTKFKKDLPLHFLGAPEITDIHYDDIKSTLITDFDGAATAFYDVPSALTETLRQLTAKKKSIRSWIDPTVRSSDIKERLVRVVQSSIHPTAILQSGPDAKGLYRFTYEDRTEPCFTGNLHEGSQNFACYIQEDTKDVWMSCFSAHCTKSGEHYLGSMDENEIEYHQDRIIVRQVYVSNILKDADIRAKVISPFQNGDIQALHVKSNPGTGKSALLSRLHEEKIIPDDATCLILTYRQSLAIELGERKLKDHGYHNYLNVLAQGGDLSDRTAYPRVVLQIDSLDKLTKKTMGIPRFDFIIIDEVESAFAHFNAVTLKDPRRLFIKLNLMCQSAKIITLDALWSDVVYGYFKRQKMVQRVIENTFVPEEKRCHYNITNAPVVKMFQEITDSLKDGRNILLATMSSQIGHDLIAFVHTHYPELAEDQIIFHHSKQSDKLKRLLNDVDILWSNAKLVIHTPSVETGTDFTRRHFYQTYLYVCDGSTSSMAAIQMSARARNNSSNTINCYVGQSINMGVADGRLATAEYIIAQSIWRDNSLNKRYYADIEKAINRAHSNIHYENQDDEMVPKIGHEDVMYVMAATAARLLNDKTRFLVNLQRYLRALGHRISIQIYDRAIKETEYEPTDVVTYYLTHRSFDDKVADGFYVNAVNQRVLLQTATEEDKWLATRIDYLRYYNLKWVDEEFVQTYGTSPYNPAQCVVLAIIWPRFVGEPSGRWQKDNTIQRANLLDELVVAFGFKHIFDYETQITQVDTEKLRRCSYFKNLEFAATLFEQKIKLNKVWDTAQYVQAVQILLTKVNLKLFSKRERIKGTDERHHVYSIERTSIEKMADLCVGKMDAQEPDWADQPDMPDDIADVLINSRDVYLSKYRQPRPPAIQ